MTKIFGFSFGSCSGHFGLVFRSRLIMPTLNGRSMTLAILSATKNFLMCMSGSIYHSLWYHFLWKLRYLSSCGCLIEQVVDVLIELVKSENLFYFPS